MRDDESLLLVPGRSGSDIFEHHVGHIRQTNAHPNIYECRQATSRGSNIGPINNIFLVNSESNTSGSNVFASEVFTKIKPKFNIKKKQKESFLK